MIIYCFSICVNYLFVFTHEFNQFIGETSLNIKISTQN